MQKGSSFGVWSQYQAPAQPSEDTLPLGSQNRQQDADRILVFLIHNSQSWLVDSSPGMSKLLFKIVALYTALLVLAPDYIYISFVKPWLQIQESDLLPITVNPVIRQLQVAFAHLRHLGDRVLHRHTSAPRCQRVGPNVSSVGFSLWPKHFWSLWFLDTRTQMEENTRELSAVHKPVIACTWRLPYVLPAFFCPFESMCMPQKSWLCSRETIETKALPRPGRIRQNLFRSVERHARLTTLF